MPILTWREEYSVGVSRIDEEHKRLIGMINTAYDSIAEMREEEALGELVEEMRGYAAEHFATEERFMRDFGYPETNLHKAAHDDFIIKAAVTDKALSTNERADHSDVFRFLADWLNAHIMGTDRKLGAFLNGKGVRQLHIPVPLYDGHCAWLPGRFPTASAGPSPAWGGMFAFRPGPAMTL